MLTRLSVLCMINGEIPSPPICFTTSPFRRIFFAFSRITLFLEVKNLITHAALTAWEMIVARAAPFTPIPNTKINTGSRQILIIAPIKTESMAILASP